MVGGRELTITYTGGDGNDVELFSTDAADLLPRRRRDRRLLRRRRADRESDDDGGAGDDDVPAGGRRNGRRAAHDRAAVAHDGARRSDRGARGGVAVRAGHVEQSRAARGRAHDVLGSDVLRRSHRERRRAAGAAVDVRRRLPGLLRHLRADRERESRADDRDDHVPARERHAGREDRAGRRVRAQDDLCRRLQRSRRPRLRHRRRSDAAGDRRARDVLREPAGTLVVGRACEHGHRVAVDVLVPRGGRDRRVLQHVHPVEQSADAPAHVDAAVPAVHGRGDRRGPRRSRRASG